MAMNNGGSDFNASRYRSAFTNGSTKKDFVKHTPFRFVPSNSAEQAALGFKRESYPTPINPGVDGRNK